MSRKHARTRINYRLNGVFANQIQPTYAAKVVARLRTPRRARKALNMLLKRWRLEEDRAER